METAAYLEFYTRVSILTLCSLAMMLAPLLALPVIAGVCFALCASVRYSAIRDKNVRRMLKRARVAHGV